MFSRTRKSLKVELGELETEKSNLVTFLNSKLKGKVTSSGKQVIVESETLSIKELQKIVLKFIYHQNLMNKYWIELQKNGVKINKFTHTEKHKNKKKSNTQLAR